MTTQITGIVRDTEGSPIPNTTLKLERKTGVGAQDGATIVPLRVDVPTDTDGSISVELYPGEYEGRVSNGRGLLIFKVGVPESIDPVELQDLIDQVPEITPMWVSEAREAKDDAQAAAGEAEASATSASDSATAASESATLADQRATDAENAAQSASEDASATAADRVATGEDAQATADDRIATEGFRDEATAAVNSLGNIFALTQSAYDELDPPDQGVLYVIVPSGEPTALNGIFAFPVEDLESVEKRPGFLYIGTEAA